MAMNQYVALFLFRSPPGSRSDLVRGGARGLAQCIGLPYSAPIVRACEFGVYKKQSPQRLSCLDHKCSVSGIGSITALHITAQRWLADRSLLPIIGHARAGHSITITIIVAAPRRLQGEEELFGRRCP